jgi:thiol-disulfide isomerase/thioredoxin
MRSVGSILILTFSLLFTGCVQNDGQSDKTNLNRPGENRLDDQIELSVDLFDLSMWQDIKSRYQGKILFINTWATWCLPCKEEFPDLVKLAKNYQDSDVIIIGVSVDYPDELESKIIPFLKSQGVNFPNYVQNFKKPESLIDLFNDQWRGAVPATFIYDEKGIQKAFLLGKQSYDEFKDAIEAIRSDS